MEKLYYRMKEDKEKLLRICENLMQKGRLVPCIGAGFSKGIVTALGKIPSSGELKEKIIELLQRHDQETTDEDFKEIGNSFNDLAEYFWGRISKNIQLKTEFMTFCRTAFRNAQDIPIAKKAFLNSGWNSIFSLNYDDVIEKCIPDICKVLPYERQNDAFLLTQKCLYKLHGDIEKFLITGDPKYFVMGKLLYVEMIRDEQNKAMLSKIKTFSLSKSLLYIGCSLKDELDLLYASEIGINNIFKEIDTIHQAHIYMHYSPGEQLLTSQEQRLRSYGITYLVFMHSEEDYNDFYNEINNIRKKIKSVSPKELDCYTGIWLDHQDNPERNIDLLFNNGLAFRDFSTKKRIEMPLFFIKRTIAQNIIEEISADTKNIFIIYGRFFSGKTLCLINILNDICDLKCFYFPSFCRLSDESIIDICTKYSHSVFLFDYNSISRNQIHILLNDNIDKIIHNKVFIILATMPADARYYYDYAIRNTFNHKDRVVIRELKNKFDGVESLEFNRRIGPLSLMEYKNNQSLLDYLLKESENHIRTANNNDFHVPINIIGNNEIDKLKAMIMLATEDVLSANKALDFGINDVLCDIENSSKISTIDEHGNQHLRGSLVERDYDLPSGTQGPGFVFVHNSKIWILLALKQYVSSVGSYDDICKAYSEIVSVFYACERSLGRGADRYYLAARQYYMFDIIQSIFINDDGGWLSLVEKIYSKLTEILCDSFQFLHQKAKCELRIARARFYTSPRFYLTKAVSNISRAIDLAKNGKDKYPDREIALAHMYFTQALIFINCSLKINEKTIEAINLLHKLLFSIDFKQYNFEISARNIEDIKLFSHNLLLENNRFPPEIQRKVNDICTAYIND